MRFPLVISTVALATLVTAAPNPILNRTGMAIPIRRRSLSPFTNPDKSVNFDALNAHVSSVMAKMHSGFVNYEQNTGLTHPLAASLNGSQKRGNGEPLTPFVNQEQWYGEITIGTPPQTFTAVIDTGFNDIIVPTTSCSSCGNHNLYDAKASSSGAKLVGKFDLPYANGSYVSGNICYDTVSVAGYAARIQYFGGASEYSGPLQYSPADGVLGMGFQSSSATHARPLVQSLKYDKKVDNAVFSLKTTFAGSELYIGGANPQLYQDEIFYTPMISEGVWHVELANIQLEDKAIFTGLDAVIDSGTFFIVGPYSQVASLYNAIGGSPLPGSTAFSIPCDLDVNFYFRLGYNSWWLIPSNLILGPVSEGSSDCVGTIVGSFLADFWIIGEPLLRGIYTIYDYDQSQVGFARLSWDISASSE